MKPLFSVKVISLDKTSADLNAIFDSGSFYSIIRTDKLPLGTTVIREETSFRTANKKAVLPIIGQTVLTMVIGEKMIQDHELVSSELGADMLIGSMTMKPWNISILNSNGKTEINVAHDMRDPEINRVD